MDADTLRFTMAITALRRSYQLTRAGASRYCGMHLESFSRYELGKLIPGATAFAKLVDGMARDEAERLKLWSLYRALPGRTRNGQEMPKPSAPKPPKKTIEEHRADAGATDAWLAALNNEAPVSRRSKTPVFNHDAPLPAWKPATAWIRRHG